MADEPINEIEGFLDALEQQDSSITNTTSSISLYCETESYEFSNDLPIDAFILEGNIESQAGLKDTVRSASSQVKFAEASHEDECLDDVGVRHGFSIQILKSCLESCIREDTGEVELDIYLDAYKEICKLLDNLGTVIRTHIGKDIKFKIALMKEHKAGPNGAYYQTVEKMIKFEKAEKIPDKNPDSNGSRTILILHRSLKFIIEFLRSLNTLRTDQGVGSIGRDAYNRTLAPFHPWGYRHIARLALSTLGKKGQLIANFHDGSLSLVDVHELIEAVVKEATKVYDRCQIVYEKNNFLKLP